MDLLYRALNDFDIACNPLVNGLASKKLIYDLTWSYLEKNENVFFQSLNDKEKEKYCKENMFTYINRHQDELKKIIDMRCSEITKSISGIFEYDLESWTHLLFYLSTLNSHLSNGSRINTDWISCSKNLNSLSKYCKNQSVHKVAVLVSCSNGILDNNTIVVDLSSKEFINNIKCFLNKKVSEDSVKSIIQKYKQLSIAFLEALDDDVFVQTSDNFVGYNYATADNETCIYRFFPSENVISVLEQLQLDLITFKMFDFKFLMLDKEKQLLELNKLKQALMKLVLKQKDAFMLHVFKKMYLENKNINIVKNEMFDENKINYNRIKILKLVKNIPNMQIKK